MKKSESGFTIVELLIVIVVIAILATISIVAYTGIQNRANDAAVQSDLKQFANKLAIFRVDNDRYPNVVGTVIAELSAFGFKANKSAYQTTGTNLLYCFDSTNAGIYRFMATSKSGQRYYVSHENSAPQILTGSFSCSPMSNTTGGYNESDTTTGPWRVWVGGN